ncbi:hypothetical protein J21TS3_47040 [Paenibacillus cookii]|uniref:Uncharacterized protein n=1 Tax=Paenibacillus cookii TaxID=157839 RepID=A0ABQ4M3A5_9BACL|nr:hypothetical protein J21TS3_47040 [Paenibacillus cookii]
MAESSHSRGRSLSVTGRIRKLSFSYIVKACLLISGFAVKTFKFLSSMISPQPMRFPFHINLPTSLGTKNAKE